MSTRQVFIIWTHPLFQESIALLLHHPEIELVGETSDYNRAPKLIDKLRPNTLLIEEAEEKRTRKFINDIPLQSWDMRILFLNLMDNQLNFFHHERRTVGNPEEIVQMILSEMR
jgi:DNA-binding NarL/FixJ family response regulator